MIKMKKPVPASAAAPPLMMESASSAGTVLPEKKVTELPLVSSNAADLVKVMGGVS